MKPAELSRRRLLATAGAFGAAALTGCAPEGEPSGVAGMLDLAEAANLRIQRLLLRADRPATEYPESAISTVFRANGSTDPDDPRYRKQVASGFADWALRVEGLVERPLSLTLAELRAMPARTQITRHDCVEGWSCIGKWTGVPLALLLDRAVPSPGARFIVFHCADVMDAGQSLEGGDDAAEDESDDKPRDTHFYESIDFFDARHVQTILAYEMNGRPLPVEHGAPLRLRLERQLGYKMAKYVMRIELVESFAGIGKGKGGYWPDQGYEWYAGI